ncbi:MAG: MATE family efflux transporter [Spirochaetota bacterium]
MNQNSSKPPKPPADRGQLLGEYPIRPLLLRMSVPAMVGMFVNALYNLVDTIFVGQAVGASGVGGLAIAFPFQIFLFALATMVGIGAASVASRALGSGDNARARKAAAQAFLLAALFGIVIFALGYTFLDSILTMFGATDGLYESAREYLQTIVFGAPVLVIAVTGTNLIRSEGRARSAMVSMLIGAGANLILDPIFIFQFGLGVRGAALATVAGFFLSAVYVVAYFAFTGSSLAPSRSDFRVSFPISREILQIGFPNFTKQLGGSVLAIVINNSLSVYGADVSIAVFGVINRLLMFAVMPMFGIVQGFQPIAGFNYGARQFDRVKEVVRTAAIATTLFTSVFFVVMQLFPATLMRAFSSDAEMIALGVTAMRIVVLVLPIIGIQLLGAAYFMAVGKALPAFILSIARQILFLIPFVVIFARLWGTIGVWLAFPVSDTLATTVTILFLRAELKKLDRKHDMEKAIQDEAHDAIEARALT